VQRDRLEASLAARHARGGFNLAELRVGLEHPTASLELEETFDLASRAGVRLRHPLLDPDLVEFVCQTPPDFFIRDGQLKGALRVPLAARFPELGWDRRPKMLATEFVNDLQRSAREGANRELEGFPALSRLGLIDGRRAWQALENPLEAGVTSGRCWELLAVEAWINQHAA
jgi:asparagine synthetase B (glutamine-hydrolysing)